MSLRKIEQIEETIHTLLTNVIKDIPDFFDENTNFYHVSFKNQSITNEASFNTSSCVIGRILHSLDQSIPYYFGNKLWEPLSKLLDKLDSNYKDDPRLEVAIPLRSFGLMPAFSMAHLSRYLLAANIFDSTLFKIAFLRILKILDLINRPELPTSILADMHPYLLHNYFEIINLFSTKLTASIYSDYSVSLIELSASIQKPNLANPSLKNLNKEIKKHNGNIKNLLQFLSPDYNLKNALESLKISIENLCYSKALTHIEWASNPKISDYDPASLLYSIFTLNQIDPNKYKNIILHGLEIVNNTMLPSGKWHPSLPFYVDEKGRAIYVTSYQIAQTTANLYASRVEDHIDKYENILDFLNKFNSWLTEHRLSITKVVPRGSSQCVGWCSDDAPDYQRVDSWVTVHALEYGIQVLRLLENIKKLLVLKQYTHSKSNKNNILNRRWEQNDFYSNIKEITQNKSIELYDIQSIIDSCNNDDKSRLAPVFILYGPPGTSKTTLAEKVSQWKGWDLIMLSPSDFVTEGLEKVEMKSRDIFYHLMKLHKTVIVLDEMDSLIRKRTNRRNSSAVTILEFIIPALLPKVQDLRNYSIKHQLVIFLITNFYGDIDSAVKREGRFDNHYLFIPLTTPQRYNFILSQLSNNGVGVNDAYKIEIFNLLESNQESKLLVYHENISLAESIQQRILQGNNIDCNSVPIKPKTIEASFYDPEDNANSEEEFNQMLKHIKKKSELKPDHTVEEIGDDVLLLSDWKEIQDKWELKKKSKKK